MKIRILNTSHWFCYTNRDITLNETAGKMIAYVRCEYYTNEKERIDFFQHVAETLQQYYSLPVSGKIAKRINQNNLCAFLFYCNDSEKEMLKNSLLHIKPLLDLKYQNWFNQSPLKTLTWSWRWKSNSKTLEEITNGTHWTYQAGLREKIK